MTTPKKPFAAALTALAFALMPHPTDAANEIGYLETFALAEDRNKALEQLIPGTQDHYYFHALHHQSEGRFDEVEKLFAPWVKRHGETARYWEIRNRQALLRYSDDPKASLDYLQKKLSLRFDHQKEELNKKPTVPTALDQKQISFETYRKRAFAAHKNLKGFETDGLERLLRDGTKLDPTRRRDLLQRLRRPDFPNLVPLIATELKTKESKGFGEFKIHSALLPEQLSALLKLQPELLKTPNYVLTVAGKLRPNADIDWGRDPQEKAAYLSKLYMFTKGLDPAFNALKAHSLYQLLNEQRSQGKYEKGLFLEYLKLPRQIGYVEPEYLKDPDRRRHIANLNADFARFTSCGTIGNDEPLVRDFFLHLFVSENSWKSYSEFVREDWLKPLFAEAKILAGAGDQEKWHAMLSANAYEALKERVDLQFANENPRTLGTADPVSLKIAIKNVSELIVKVYEVNPLNYYLQEGREVNTDLQLDGLIANAETRHEYDEPPLRRVWRDFEFPDLTSKRGVWVIEFIGNGRSSRALIRKGGLQHLAKPTPAGTQFTILDLDNQPVENPSLWVGGRQFTPDKEGLLTVPFSTAPGRQPIVLADGKFAALEFFEMPAERYALQAGFHVDAETLIPGHTTSLVVRPSLSLNGAPTTLALIEDAVLTISSVDLDGVSSTLESPDFQLAEDRESTHEFRVPERLSQLHVNLSGSIQNVSTGERVAVSAHRTFAVNGINASAHLWQPHLAKFGDDYVIEVLGKTGEPLADIPVRLRCKHRDFSATQEVMLKSAPNGQINLGPLQDIAWISASNVPAGDRQWQLGGDHVNLPGSLHGLAGTALKIPYAGSAKKISADDFALLETRNGSYASDHLKALDLEDGFLMISGLPRGDFELTLKELGEVLTIRLTEGETKAGYVLGEYRHLQTKTGSDLAIAKIESADQKTRIHLGGANAFTRVHLVATRYAPEFPLLEALGAYASAEPFLIRRGSSTSRYLSGRDIGDEYRYIIDRRGAEKFPGNMLVRPGLLLNPWAIRDTDTETNAAEDGEKWGASEADEKPVAVAAPSKPKSSSSRFRRKSEARAAITPTFDFLLNGSTVLHNLVPDENGVVTIDTEDLGDRQFLHVLAVDPQNSAYRQLALADRHTKVRDLRLGNGLTADGHFSEQKQSTQLADGETLTIDDVRTAKVESYQDLSRVYTYLSALNSDSTFAEFRFLIDWPELKDEQKAEKYSKYACHELHFFLAKRDPEFFEAVVKPYLANKRDKTFMDEYLLGADLAHYLEPWRFGRLNAVERILLGQATGGSQPAGAVRHIDDLLDLQPRNIGRENVVFDTAVKGLGLSAEPTTVTAALDDAQNAATLRMERGRGAVSGKKLRSLGAVMDEAPSDDPFASGPGAGDDAFAAAPEPAAQPLRRSLKRQSELKKKYANEARLSESLVEEEEELMDYGESDGAALGGGAAAGGRYAYFGRRSEMEGRELAERLFRQLEKTKEYAENNYYERRITDQGASLVVANAFWQDYAEHLLNNADKPFLSAEFGHASGSFTEMVFALAVLDLPFAAESPEAVAGAVDGDNPLSFTITATGPTIVFHREIKKAPISDERSPLLVAQNYFNAGDRYQTKGGERHDKFVRGEFLTGVLYGSQVAITNPTSTRQKLDLLTQIPVGALPCSGSKYTTGQHFSIEPYATQTAEFYFYFPAPSGERPFDIFPAHAAKNEEIVAWADGLTFDVVRQATKIDTSSWDYISQHADEKAVLDFLSNNNPRAVDLARIAWRMRDADFFKAAIALLEQRHVYNDRLYSYGLHHNHTAIAREFLTHQDPFLNSCGIHLESELLSINPVERHRYEHLEYAPLVNARAHTLGKERKILNDAFLQQYQRLLKVLSYKAKLDADDQLAVTYYLFLQDRIAEALHRYDGVEASAVAEELQHEYLSCYAAFYRGDAAAAKKIANQYAKHPVKRWRERFEQVIAHADGINGKGAIAEVDPGGDAEAQRDDEHADIASGETALDVKVEGGKVKIDYRNATDAVVNYYRMDLEFLFSTQPFLSGEAARFSIIQPNFSAKLKLAKGKDTHSFAVPREFASENVLIEIVANGKRRATAHYANSLKLTLSENYGLVEVRDAKASKPIPRAYIKVYARSANGQPVFYKDGYTDLRGKFDYASLSTSDLDGATRFALLIMSEDNGAVVKEVNPPVR